MAPSIEFFGVERQESMPVVLDEWLQSHPIDPLAPIWVVVPSAAIRQSVEWQLSTTRHDDAAISSNMHYLFPEEFVRTIEERVLGAEDRERHEWRPETIATRLISLSGGSITWAQALAEAQTIDEVVRWRPDQFDSLEMSALGKMLVATDEWRRSGPLTQRDAVLAGLSRRQGNLPPLIALYGLESAPGGAQFITLVKAIAAVSAVAVITPYPSAERLDAPTNTRGISWWHSLDEHVELWRSHEVAITAKPGPTRNGVLGNLQRSLADGRTAGDVDGPTNVRVFGAVGPARQTEIARYVILEILELHRDEAHPHNILVTSPDIAAFASHIERHWAHPPYSGDGERLPRLAFELTERESGSIKNRSILAGHLLDLVGSYVSLEQVEALLQFPSLLQTIAFDDDSVQRLATLARDAHVTFGASPQQRQELQLFSEQSHVGSWQRFFDRLALSAMLPDVDDPDQLGTSNDLSLIAGLSVVTNSIESAQASLGKVSTLSIEGWLSWLEQYFGHLLERAGSRDDSLERTIEQIRRDFAWDDDDVAVAFEFFRDYWNSLVATSARAQNFGKFGVHVAPLSALASGSYDYVVILGLDEERFPNANITSPTLQPPRIGDPSPRHAMLGSLLLTIGSAKQELIVLYNSRNELTGENVKSPVILNELLQYAGGHIRVVDTPRHGFVQPIDGPHAQQTFDSRFAGLGSVIAQSHWAEPLVLQKINEMSAATTAIDSPKTLPLKSLQHFLKNSASHFITRGLLGEHFENWSSEELPPRIQYNALQNHSLRMEIVERLITSGCSESEASRLFFEITRREAVAADIPFALLDGLLNSAQMASDALAYRSDLACFDQLTEDEEASFYAPIELPCGIALHPRTGLGDERNKWTVLRDFSSRQHDGGGGPGTIRFYPQAMKVAVKERRSTLAMFVDLLAMKINAPEGESLAPTATEFFAGTTKTFKQNPLVTYRYDGPRDAALASLDALVQLFLRGTQTPLAIGRYTTPLLLEGVDPYAGFVKDRSDASFAIIFGDELTTFQRLMDQQDLARVFKGITDHVSLCRETASARTADRISKDSKRSTFKTIDEWRKGRAKS